jgi:hypothetical protein
MQWGLCRSGHGGDGGRGKENGCSGSGLMEKNIRLVFLVLIIFFLFFLSSFLVDQNCFFSSIDFTKIHHK